ncbi:pyridoxamine 5'-phosphate oxidase family protein [Streptomyces collinus]|uniref:pyridoxamine 5'-phosphate oxidase family protein n=1 Tax=Streptomyces collinus TaxID=42684 RepID=UPI0037F4D060
MTTPDGPAMLPVYYEVVDDALVFRTSPDAAPAVAVGTEVAFEVDHIDDAMSQGWSVLAVGRAEAVRDPDEVRRLDARAHTDPGRGKDAHCG